MRNNGENVDQREWVHLLIINVLTGSDILTDPSSCGFRHAGITWVRVSQNLWRMGFVALRCGIRKEMWWDSFITFLGSGTFLTGVWWWRLGATQ